MPKNKKIFPVYVSKNNSNREKQAILLIITSRKKWHYHAVKKLLAIFRQITPKNNGDVYCLNCLDSFRTKNKLESHKKVCENKDFCNLIMPSQSTIYYLCRS